MLTLKRLKNSKGMATIETVPLIVLFVLLFAFTLGFFGAIHTAILFSISARTYAFETFRNRTNLTYFRENYRGITEPKSYRPLGTRYHFIQSATEQTDDARPAARPMVFGRALASRQGSIGDHNQKIYELGPRNRSVEVNPIWVKVGYGMCLDARCGGSSLPNLRGN
jgi:hypothetical protein